MSGRTTSVEKFIEKCNNKEYTKFELDNCKKSLQSNLKRGIRVSDNRKKLDAVITALASENYKTQEEDIPMKKSYTDIVNTLNEFQTEDDFESQVAGRYLQLKNGAYTRGKDFNLTLLDIRRMMQRKTCFYTRKRFDESSSNWKRTFERVDPHKGYVKGNVVVCSKWANALKNVMFEEEGAALKGCRKELRKFMDTVSSLKVKL